MSLPSLFDRNSVSSESERDKQTATQTESQTDADTQRAIVWRTQNSAHIYFSVPKIFFLRKERKMRMTPIGSRGHFQNPSEWPHLCSGCLLPLPNLLQEPAGPKIPCHGFKVGIQNHGSRPTSPGTGLFWNSRDSATVQILEHTTRVHSPAS